MSGRRRREIRPCSVCRVQGRRAVLCASSAGAFGAGGLALSRHRAAATDDPWVTSSPRLVVGGVTRSYELVRGRGREAGTSLPVLVLLHGRNMSAAAMAAMAGFDQIAPAAVLVYPERLPGIVERGDCAAARRKPRRRRCRVPHAVVRAGPRHRTGYVGGPGLPRRIQQRRPHGVPDGVRLPGLVLRVCRGRGRVGHALPHAPARAPARGGIHRRSAADRASRGAAQAHQRHGPAHGGGPHGHVASGGPLWPDAARRRTSGRCRSARGRAAPSSSRCSPAAATAGRRRRPG